MTTNRVIREIKELPPEEQAQVVRLACRLGVERKLTGAELSALAEQMTNTKNPVEALKIREAIERGFYGGNRGSAQRESLPFGSQPCAVATRFRS